MQREATIAGGDQERIIEAIFGEGNPTVYEAYSAYDSEIVAFISASDLSSYIARPRPRNESILGFAVHYPDTGGFVEKIKINLDKEKCNGHTYRYTMNGWGLIQFQLNMHKAPKMACRFDINTEKRENMWFATYLEFKSSKLWDWAGIEKHIRRLIRVLKKHAQQGAPADTPKSACY